MNPHAHTHCPAPACSHLGLQLMPRPLTFDKAHGARSGVTSRLVRRRGHQRSCSTQRTQRGNIRKRDECANHTRCWRAWPTLPCVCTWEAYCGGWSPTQWHQRRAWTISSASLLQPRARRWIHTCSWPLPPDRRQRRRQRPVRASAAAAAATMAWARAGSMTRSRRSASDRPRSAGRARSWCGRPELVAAVG